MFISVGKNIKFHQWPNYSPNLDYDYQYKPDAFIRQISMCSDNSFIALVQDNIRVKIIATRNKNDIHVVHSINAIPDISVVCFKSLTKRYLGLGTQQGEVHIYDTRQHVITSSFPQQPSPITGLDFSMNDQYLATSSEKRVIVYENLNKDSGMEYKHPARCSVIKFHPSRSEHLAVGCENGRIYLWDVGSKAKILDLSPHNAKITGIAMSKMNNFIITAGRDQKIIFLNVLSSEKKFKINLHLPVTCIEICKDDRTVAAGLEDGSIFMYDLQNPVLPVCTLKPHNCPVSQIVFDNNSNILRTRSSSQMIDDGSESTLSESDFKDAMSVLVVDGSYADKKKRSNKLQKIEQDILKLIKKEMDEVENQLDEQCLKFQAFITNEFENIQDVIREKQNILF